MYKQAHISKSLKGLHFRKVYGLTRYTKIDEPLIIFGMYRYEDYEAYLYHESFVKIVWCGGDARQLNKDWNFKINDNKVTHIALSKKIQRRLKKFGIHSTFIPVCAVKPKINPKPKGHFIYMYSSDASKKEGNFYGDKFISEIEYRTGFKIIRATLKTYSKAELLKIYEKCFINLRLTKSDGCPNTNIEMGLMGRKSIFNGDIPHSTKWKNIDDICASIMIEYYKGDHDNEKVAQDIYNFINIKKQFLNG